MKLILYARLARLHQPIGIILLWLPTAWALSLAGATFNSYLMLLFFLGTIFMRSAGCVVNDIADRQIDLHVTRTKLRPLTSGKITLIEALLVLAFFLFVSLIVVLQLPLSCFIYAIIALIITIAYPFTKRFIRCPQLMLGLAFSMGIPMAYIATNGSLTFETLLLFVINFLWIVSYDTEYALADRADDITLGVNSTALFFGRFAQLMIGLLQIIMHGLWLVLLPHTEVILVAWMAAGLILIYQHRLLAANVDYFAITAFRSNSYYGLIIWIGILLNN